MDTMLSRFHLIRSLREWTVCVLLAAGIYAGPALASQGATPSQMTGQVVDPNNVPVPGMTMAATSTTSGARFKGISGKDGRFVIVVVEAGRYEVTGSFGASEQESVAIPGKFAVTVGPGQTLVLPTYHLPYPLETFRLMVDGSTALAQRQYVKAAAAYERLVVASPTSSLYLLLSESYLGQYVPAATQAQNERVLTLAKQSLVRAAELTPDPAARKSAQAILSSPGKPDALLLREAYLRMRANEEKDPKARQALIDEADLLRGRPEKPAVPVRVGAGIPAPKKIKHVEPEYPAAAQKAGVQGFVNLDITVGPDGSVTDAKVMTPKPPLDAAAIAAVKQWRYEPTVRDGVAIPVRMNVLVSFFLK
jgi:TonB family protein